VVINVDDDDDFGGVGRRWIAAEWDVAPPPRRFTSLTKEESLSGLLIAQRCACPERRLFVTPRGTVVWRCGGGIADAAYVAPTLGKPRSETSPVSYHEPKHTAKAKSKTGTLEMEMRIFLDRFMMNNVK
jgi:hypothetical protein